MHGYCIFSNHKTNVWFVKNFKQYFKMCTLTALDHGVVVLCPSSSLSVQKLRDLVVDTVQVDVTFRRWTVQIIRHHRLSCDRLIRSSSFKTWFVVSASSASNAYSIDTFKTFIKSLSTMTLFLYIILYDNKPLLLQK